MAGSFAPANLGLAWRFLSARALIEVTDAKWMLPMQLIILVIALMLGGTAAAHPSAAHPSAGHPSAGHPNSQGVAAQQQAMQQQATQQPSQPWGCQPQQPSGNVVTRTVDAAKNQAEAEVQHEARRRVNRAFGRLFGR